MSDVLVDYAMLHDISKPDSLTLKVEGEKKGIEIAWEQWQNIKAAGEPVPDRRQADNLDLLFPCERGIARNARHQRLQIA